VEFAITLPFLALLLVMVVDGGRMYFGLVALQNASRIGADYAAAHADAWDGPPDGIQQNQRDRYQDLVQNDLTALGCQSNTVPDPNFDPDGDGIQDFSDGATVRVSLVCNMAILTPLAQAFLGTGTLSASTDFTVRRTINSDLPPPPAPPPPVGCDPGQLIVPDMVGHRMQDAYDMWTGAGFTGSFTPAVTNPNKNKTVLTQSLEASVCADADSVMLVTHS
jgi:hypothetical protein